VLSCKPTAPPAPPAVALPGDGRQDTCAPAAFAKRFGSKNDPEKAIFLGKRESDMHR
jgi:hypothetical protein